MKRFIERIVSSNNINVKNNEWNDILSYIFLNGYYDERTIDLVINLKKVGFIFDNLGKNLLIQSIKMWYFDLVNFFIDNWIYLDDLDNVALDLDDWLSSSFNERNLFLFLLEKWMLNIALKLLWKWFDINSTDSLWDNWLHYVIRNGNFEDVRVLVQKGIDINKINNTGESPLIVAIDKGDTTTALFLIDNNANLNSKDKSILSCCIASNNLVIFNALIVKGINVLVEDIYFAYKQMKEPFFFLLMKHDILNINNIITSEGNGLIHLFVLNNDLTSLQLLIKKSININALNDEWESCIHLAIKWHLSTNFLPIIEFLVSNWIDLNLKNGIKMKAESFWEDAFFLNEESWKYTWLHLAVILNQVDIIKFLSDHGAELDCRDLNEDTPLTTSIKLDKFEIVRSLVQFWANINLPAWRTWETPLMIAIQNEKIDIANFLIDSKSDVNIKWESGGNWGDTALIIASRKWLLNICIKLVQAGADLTIMNDAWENCIVVAGTEELRDYLLNCTWN